APPTPERPPKLWTGTIKAPPKGEFTGLTLSSDGQSLVTTSEEKVALWDLRTGKLVRERSGKEAAPDSPVFVSQDKEIAFEHDLAVHVVDRETLKIRTSLEKVGVGGISSLTASRDGAHLAGWRGETLAVWDVAQRKALWHKEFGEKRFSISEVAFSPDGKVLALGVLSARDSVRLLDARTGAS